VYFQITAPKLTQTLSLTSLKLFNLLNASLFYYIGTVESGSGINAVQTRLDTLLADHIDQKDISQGRLDRLGTDAAQLTEAGHPLAMEKTEIIETFTTRLDDISAAANGYSDRLAQDLEREKQLVGIQAKERASRNGSTVVDISMTPPTFQPVSVSVSRSPLF